MISGLHLYSPTAYPSTQGYAEFPQMQAYLHITLDVEKAGLLIGRLAGYLEDRGDRAKRSFGAPSLPGSKDLRSRHGKLSLPEKLAF